MKLSVSLSADDLAALDRYVEQAGLESRSAAVQQAIRRLQDPELEAAYAAAKYSKMRRPYAFVCDEEIARHVDGE